MSSLHTRPAICAVFLSALVFSAGGLVAEPGSFFIKWSDRGPANIKVLFRDGAQPAIILSQWDTGVLPQIYSVVWPTTETRPAPATGTIRGLVFTNNFDPATQTRQYEELLEQFRYCVRLAALVAARQAEFDLELFVYMDDTSQSWKGWGNDPDTRNVAVQTGARLTCTLNTKG